MKKQNATCYFLVASPCEMCIFTKISPNMSIEVENISKSYGDQLALNGVSFNVGKPEIVGFLGPNGAGKSTMMKILTTYLEPSSGQARVNGYDVISQSKDVQKSIGYLPEHNPLYPDMYVKEYLEFNRRVQKADKNAINKVIKLTGLADESHKKIGQLSKGYRQRVGLANALLHDPEVLILDEPTTGLDPNQILEIRDLIRDIGKERTVFLSTHIMQEVEATCDRVIIIDKGEIVADKDLASLRETEEQIILVEFDFRVEEAFLNKLPHVNKVTNIHDFIYEISFGTQEDMRTVVFDFAAENELKILELNRKNLNLEELFQKLTKP